MGETRHLNPTHAIPSTSARDETRTQLLFAWVARDWPAAADREVAGLPQGVADLLRPARAGGVLGRATQQLDRALAGWVEVAAEAIAQAEEFPREVSRLCLLVARRALQDPLPLLRRLNTVGDDPEPRFWLLVALSGTDTAAVRTAWREELRRCGLAPSLAGTRAAWFAFARALLGGWLTWPEFRDALLAGRALAAVDRQGRYRRPLERLGLWAHPVFAKWYRQVVYEVAAQPDVALSFATGGWIREFSGHRYLLDALARLQEEARAWWPLYLLRWTSDLPADPRTLAEELRPFSPTALCLLALLRPDLAEAVEEASGCPNYAAVIRWLRSHPAETPAEEDWCRTVLAPWVQEYHEVITVATGALCSLVPPLDYAPEPGEATPRRSFFLKHLGLDLETLMDNFLFVLALSDEHFPMVEEEARRGRTSALRALALRPEFAERTAPLLLRQLRGGAKPARLAAQEALVQLAERAGLKDLGSLEQRLDLALAWADSNAGGTLGPLWWEIAGYHLRLTIVQGEVRQEVYAGARSLRSVPEEVRTEARYAEVRRAREELTRRYRYLRRRLEQVMEEGVSYRGRDFAVLLSSPAARSLVAGLVLLVEGEEFHWSPADPILESEAPVEIARAEQVQVAHPMHLHHAGTLAAWQARLVTQGFAQPFKQLFRESYVVGEGEHAATHCARFSQRPVNARHAFALLRRRGYTPGRGLAVKDWAHAGVRACIAWAGEEEPVGKLLGRAAAESPVTFGAVWFSRTDGTPLTLGETPPVIFSETLRDADLTVSRAAFGEAGFSSEETRRLRALLIQHLSRALGLTTIYVSEDHSSVLIEGQYAMYRLHLGSGSVLLEHNRRHLEVSGLAEEAAPHTLLAGMDSFTTHIVRTVLALSQDTQITNPHFLQQLGRSPQTGAEP